MDALTDLALIWTGVLVAAYAARHTRLTPVHYFLAVGAVFVNLGILPEQPHGITILKVALFFLIVSALGAWVFPHPVKGWLARLPVIRHFGIRHLLGFERCEYASPMILLLALGVGLLARVPSGSGRLHGRSHRA